MLKMPLNPNKWNQTTQCCRTQSARKGVLWSSRQRLLWRWLPGMVLYRTLVSLPVKSRTKLSHFAVMTLMLSHEQNHDDTRSSFLCFILRTSSCLEIRDVFISFFISVYFQNSKFGS